MDTELQKRFLFNFSSLDKFHRRLSVTNYALIKTVSYVL